MLEYKDNKNPKKLEIDDLEKIIIIIQDSFRPEARLELLNKQQPEKKKLWLLKSKRHYEEEREITLSAEKNNELLTKLKALTLPEHKKLALGLDGTTYSIDFITKSGHCFYEWWGEAPDGYGELKNYSGLL